MPTVPVPVLSPPDEGYARYRVAGSLRGPGDGIRAFAMAAEGERPGELIHIEMKMRGRFDRPERGSPSPLGRLQRTRSHNRRVKDRLQSPLFGLSLSDEAQVPRPEGRALTIGKASTGHRDPPVAEHGERQMDWDFFRGFRLWRRGEQGDEETQIPTPTLTKFRGEFAYDPAFLKLAQAASPKAAQDYLNTSYDVNIRQYFRPDAPMAQQNYEYIVEQTKSGMELEARKARTNLMRIDGIARRGASGALRKELLDERNQAARQSRRLQGPLSEIDPAADWVIERSGSIAAGDQQTRDILVAAMRRVVRTMDVLDVSTLEYLHRHVGRFNGQHRWGGGATRSAFYTGPAVGKFLQHQVAIKARALANMAVRNPMLWYDVACLQLTGNIIAHGFVDGNGRSARALFACTLIKNRRRFVVPHRQWTKNQVLEQDLGKPITDWLTLVVQDRLPIQKYL